MSIFGSILSKIFPSNHPSVVAALANSASTGNAPEQLSSASAAPSVDVEAVLSGLAQKSSEKLNWQTSIVDLMKLLGLDSSLGVRKTLAKELGYNGNPDDSAAMNQWLSKQVMAKLASNGGKVPSSLLH